MIFKLFCKYYWWPGLLASFTGTSGWVRQARVGGVKFTNICSNVSEEDPATQRQLLGEWSYYRIAIATHLETQETDLWTNIQTANGLLYSDLLSSQSVYPQPRKSLLSLRNYVDLRFLVVLDKTYKPNYFSVLLILAK